MKKFWPQISQISRKNQDILPRIFMNWHEEIFDADFPKDMGKQTSGNDTGAFAG